MNSPATDYSSYETEDFLNDKQFVAWVQHPSADQDRYWEQVQQEYPLKAYQMEEARRLVQKLSFRASTMEQAEQQQLWRAISEEAGLTRKSVPLAAQWLRKAGAAVVALMLLSLALYFYNSSRHKQFRTAYGQVATLVLPDSSVVTLNANSEIRYASDWDADEPREVWLEGEAFFEVNHLHRQGSVKPGERFVVHTGDMDVEVLGTSFNVQKRRGATQVALQTGKVRLALEGASSPVVMKPGDVVAYTPANSKLVQWQADPQLASAWRGGLLVFQDTPLAEILTYIEDTYGYQVELKDEDLAQRRLSGRFRSRNEEALLDRKSVV